MSSIEIANLDVKAAEIKRAHSELAAKLMGIDSKLSGLTTRVRGSKTHKTALSQADYRGICNEQQRLKNKKMEITVECSELKNKLREIAAQRSVAYSNLVADDSEKQITMSAFIDAPQLDLRDKLVKLRDKWIGFAEDQTRVNSMRVMAAQFSRELTEII